MPRQVQFTGAIPGVQGSVALSFGIYAEQEGGAPLWLEIHAAVLDGAGRYSVWLGSLSGGLPMHLFQNGEARWLGVRADARHEQPRVRFLSVPYALKAADADTLGGLPVSAFVLSTGARQELKRAFGGPGRTVNPFGLSAGEGEVPAAFGIVDRDVPRRDQVIPDDLIVQGSGCFGFDCVNNESFGFDTIRLKENNLRIKFEDTSVGAFPTNDWQLTANDSASGGASKFSIEDITGAKVPFTITAGAATNSIFVDSTGRVGLRTNAPVLDLHTRTTNTPAMRLEQTNGGGFTAQTWDIGSNEANFFVRDVTSGSRLPFRIRPGAPTSSIDISADGDVGIGTGSPTALLDVNGNLAIGSGGLLVFRDDQDTGFGTQGAASDTLRFVTNGANRAFISATGNVGIGTIAPGTLLHVNAAADGNVLRLQDADGTCDHNPEAGSETVSCSSDERLKTDIADAAPVLPYLQGLRIRDYKVRASGTRLTGVIAQETLTRYPDLVTQEADGLFKVSEISSWRLVKGLQELAAAQTSQTDELSALKALVAAQADAIEQLRKELEALRRRN